MMRTAIATSVVLALAACATIESRPPDNPQAVVNQRVAVMRTFGQAVGTATNAAQGKTTAAAAKAKLSPARAGLARVPGLFPRGTALGDKGVTQSRALSTIFTNRSDFERKFDALDTAFAGLDAALASASKETISKAVANVRSACTQCHNKYRAAEED
jgi:cytochrome c556